MVGGDSSRSNCSEDARRGELIAKVRPEDEKPGDGSRDLPLHDIVRPLDRYPAVIAKYFWSTKGLYCSSGWLEEGRD